MATTKAQQAKEQAIQNARRTAFIKSLSGHIIGASLAALGAVIAYYQDNPAAGVAGGLLAVFLPMVRNWYDKQNSNYGKSK